MARPLHQPSKPVLHPTRADLAVLDMGCACCTKRADPALVGRVLALRAEVAAMKGGGVFLEMKTARPTG